MFPLPEYLPTKYLLAWISSDLLIQLKSFSARKLVNVYRSNELSLQVNMRIQQQEIGIMKEFLYNRNNINVISAIETNSMGSRDSRNSLHQLLVVCVHVHFYTHCA